LKAGFLPLVANIERPKRAERHVKLPCFSSTHDQASDIARRTFAKSARCCRRRGWSRLLAISGAGGRLVFAYFIALANTLSIAEFGMFATASAAGVMLSRILAFGFISALYRTATIRSNLIGTFTAGFLLLALVSLPVLAAASYGVYLIFFASNVPLSVFAAIVFAEALLWRPVEVALIVNNGLGKFGRAAVLAILATALRALGAVLFMFAAERTVDVWSWYYIGANAASLLLAFGFFYPRQRLRLRVELYLGCRFIYVAGRKCCSMQMEFDKLLLAIGGPHLAGIYAIIMRLVDLTAIPIRTFSMMLVQRMMRAGTVRAWRSSAASKAACSWSRPLHCWRSASCCTSPNALGKNVAEAAPWWQRLCAGIATWSVSGRAVRARPDGGQGVNLGMFAGLKAVLLTYVLTAISDTLVVLSAASSSCCSTRLDAAHLFGNAPAGEAGRFRPCLSMTFRKPVPTFRVMLHPAR
jgi:hypothetical protein